MSSTFKPLIVFIMRVMWIFIRILKYISFGHTILLLWPPQFLMQICSSFVFMFAPTTLLTKNKRLRISVGLILVTKVGYQIWTLTFTSRVSATDWFIFPLKVAPISRNWWGKCVGFISDILQRSKGLCWSIIFWRDSSWTFQTNFENWSFMKKFNLEIQKKKYRKRNKTKHDNIHDRISMSAVPQI